MCFLTFCMLPFQRSAGVRSVFSGSRAAEYGGMSAERLRQRSRTKSKAKFRTIRLSPGRACQELQEGPSLSSWEALYAENDLDEGPFLRRRR